MHSPPIADAIRFEAKNYRGTMITRHVRKTEEKTKGAFEFFRQQKRTKILQVERLASGDPGICHGQVYRSSSEETLALPL